MTENAKVSAALVAALADLSVIDKDQTATIPGKDGKRGYSYTYVDLASIVAKTRPVLKEHGLVALTPIHDHGAGLACTVTILHESGERLDLGPFPFPHGRDAQATGSMVTYHRRYALLAALGIAAGDDDDDGAAATAGQAQPETPAEERTISATNAQALIDKATEAGLSVAEVVKLGTKGRTDDPTAVLLSEVRAVKEAMDNLTPADPTVTGSA